MPEIKRREDLEEKNKADDIEDVEITSEEDNIEENNKPQADDFFIQEEEDSKSHIFYN